MKKTAWLVTLWLIQDIAIAQYVDKGKCCPPNQVISVENNFNCADFDARDRQLYYSKDILEISDQFLGCDETGMLSAFSNLQNKTVSMEVQNCLDLMWDEKEDQIIPIVFGCGNNFLTVNETLSNDAGNPILVNLRVCCPSQTAYNVDKRDCMRLSKPEDSEHGALSIYYQLMDAKSSPDFVTVVRGPPSCENAILNYQIDVTKDLRVLDDAETFEVIVSTRTGEGPITILADEDNSCFDSGSDKPVVRVCSGPKFCENNACVRKCCPEGESMVNDECVWTFPFPVEPGTFHKLLMNESITRGSAMAKAHSLKFMQTSDYGLLIGKPCKYGMFPVEHREEWYFTPRGEFNLTYYRAYQTDEYCMEISSHDLEKGRFRLKPFVCFDESITWTEESPVRYGIFAILQLTSCIFLILTFLVYVCLPSLRNLHGKTLMCHVASLIVAYATLAIVALGTPSNIDDDDNADDDDQPETTTAFCKFLGFTLLLSWISAFTWLNVMCFDIWWTFGGLGGGAGGEIPGPRRTRAYRRRFQMYSLYAWGFSFLITIFGIVVDNTEIFPEILRPHVGSDSCWFERNVRYYGEIIFFVGPVSIQLVANVIFFILTAMYCSKVKAEISRVTASPNDARSKRFRADKTKLIMNAKLFIVMGVSWCLEVISSYMSHWAATVAWQTEFFLVSDVFNCLQGVLIFMLFVLKRKVFQALKKRFGMRNSHQINQTPQSKSHNGSGLQDPYRMKNSASSSTLVSTYGGAAGVSVSSSPL